MAWSRAAACGAQSRPSHCAPAQMQRIPVGWWRVALLCFYCSCFAASAEGRRNGRGSGERRCKRLLQAAESASTVEGLDKAENACVAELSAAGAADPAYADEIYSALLWYCNTVVPTDDALDALARAVKQPEKRLPFFQNLRKGRRAAMIDGPDWHRGLQIAHSEILAARTPGMVAFTLNSCKLAWRASWSDTTLSFAQRAVEAPCGEHDYQCGEKPLALELAVLALTRLGRHAEAEAILAERVLAAQPDDYERAYDLWRAERLQDKSVPSVPVKTASTAYRQVAASATNSYGGFDPSTDTAWSPEVFAGFPSTERLLELIHQRKPAVFNIASTQSEGPGWESIGWQVDRWRDPEYLVRAAGTVAVKMLGMPRNQPVGLRERYGLCGACPLDQILFSDFVRQIFRANATQLDADRFDRYITLQGGAGYTGALSGALSQDIPIPLQLQALIGDETTSPWRTARLQDVNLWMGQARAHDDIDMRSDGADGTFVSQMHWDASENIYAVLQGTKNFRLIAPSVAHLLHTIAPIVRVTPRGLCEGANSTPSYTRATATGHFAMHGTPFDFVAAGDDPSSNVERTQAIDAATVDVEVRAGQMLFVPAGWFHEVRSSGGAHMAVNFWWRDKAAAPKLEF